MTTARRTLGRMTCPTCGRQVAFRLVGTPKVHRGQLIPGIRVPVNHLNPQGEPCQPTKRPP
jgi:hypothetical protein